MGIRWVITDESWRTGERTNPSDAVPGQTVEQAPAKGVGMQRGYHHIQMIADIRVSDQTGLVSLSHERGNARQLTLMVNGQDIR